MREMSDGSKPVQHFDVNSRQSVVSRQLMLQQATLSSSIQYAHPGTLKTVEALVSSW